MKVLNVLTCCFALSILSACDKDPTCVYPVGPVAPTGYAMKAIGPISATGERSNAGAFQMFDMDVGCLIGYPGWQPSLYKTANGGKTWTAEALPFIDGVRSFVFADPQTGWLTRRKADTIACLMKTVDGGASYTEHVYPNISKYFSRIMLAEDGELYAVIDGYGEGSGIARSTDGGATFERVYSSQGQYISHLNMLEKYLYFFDNGRLVINSRDGTSTTSYPKPVRNYTGDLFVIDKDRLLFVADDRLEQSIDGGATWSLLHDGETVILGGDAATDGILLHLKTGECGNDVPTELSAFAILKDELDIGPEMVDFDPAAYRFGQYLGEGRWMLSYGDEQLYEMRVR